MPEMSPSALMPWGLVASAPGTSIAVKAKLGVSRSKLAAPGAREEIVTGIVGLSPHAVSMATTATVIICSFSVFMIGSPVSRLALRWSFYHRAKSRGQGPNVADKPASSGNEFDLARERRVLGPLENPALGPGALHGLAGSIAKITRLTAEIGGCGPALVLPQGLLDRVPADQRRRRSHRESQSLGPYPPGKHSIVARETNHFSGL